MCGFGRVRAICEFPLVGTFGCIASPPPPHVLYHHFHFRSHPWPPKPSRHPSFRFSFLVPTPSCQWTSLATRPPFLLQLFFPLLLRFTTTILLHAPPGNYYLLVRKNTTEVPYQAFRMQARSQVLNGGKLRQKGAVSLLGLPSMTSHSLNAWWEGLANNGNLSGCCEPPSSCNFTHVDANDWIPSNNTSTSTNSDCATWNNDPSKLCYYCDSCKTVIIYTTWRQWKKYRTLLLFSISILLTLYTFCGCALLKHEVVSYV